MDPLFALLRLGLDTSSLDNKILLDIIKLSAEKWRLLGEIARNQGVLGVLLDGVEKLDATCYGLPQELDVNRKLDWIGEVLQIEQRNRKQTKVMCDMAEKWSRAGCRVMLIKGQANSLLYPTPLHRTPGDIDCYLFGNYALGNKIASKAGAG